VQRWRRADRWTEHFHTCAERLATGQRHAERRICARDPRAPDAGGRALAAHAGRIAYASGFVRLPGGHVPATYVRGRDRGARGRGQRVALGLVTAGGRWRQADVRQSDDIRDAWRVAREARTPLLQMRQPRLVRHSPLCREREVEGLSGRSKGKGGFVLPFLDGILKADSNVAAASVRTRARTVGGRSVRAGTRSVRTRRARMLGRDHEPERASVVNSDSETIVDISL
jgi:hypothetical protein